MMGHTRNKRIKIIILLIIIAAMVTVPIVSAFAQAGVPGVGPSKEHYVNLPDTPDDYVEEEKKIEWTDQILSFLDAQEKEKILKATDLCTTVTGRRLGHPVRSLRTPFARAYAKGEFGGMSDEDLEEMGTGALRRAVQEGDPVNGCFLAGQAAAMVRREQPAAEIIQEVMEEAEAVLRTASLWVK